MIGGEGLRLSWLACGELGTRSNFGASASCIPHGKNKLTSYSADLRGGGWRGFLAARRADQREAK
jgi:hypothetical protein